MAGLLSVAELPAGAPPGTILQRKVLFAGAAEARQLPTTPPLLEAVLVTAGVGKVIPPNWVALTGVNAPTTGAASEQLLAVRLAKAFTARPTLGGWPALGVTSSSNW